MKDIIKSKYKRKAVIYDNIWMYFLNNALEIIAECKNKKINILSLEAFRISGKGIQPSQEHSIDFSQKDGNWEKAIDFLNQKENSDYLYEIWYEGY